MIITPPLNSPLEAGLRVMFLLASGFPVAFDLSSLVQLDHALLHTGQNDGPPSIHPELPGSVGELAVKHELIKAGLDAMMRAGLVSAQPTINGFEFRATENALGFVSVLDTPYAKTLRDRADWVQRARGDLGPHGASGVRNLLGQWILGRERTQAEDV